MEEYPSTEQLEYIEKYSLIDGDPFELIEYIREIWWPNGKYGFILRKGMHHLSKKPCSKLQLHTVGWSGNESIIQALGANMFFFPMYWWKTVVGGHYYFEIRREKKRKSTQIKE